MVWKFIKGLPQRLITRLASIQAHPRQIAGGYALGFFLGTTPFIGLKVWIALVVATVLKWNRPAAVIGVYHINGLTGPPFYALAFLLGKLTLGAQLQFVMPDDYNLKAIFLAFMGNWDIFTTLLIGGLIIGIPGTILLYLASYYLVQPSTTNILE